MQGVLRPGLRLIGLLGLVAGAMCVAMALAGGQMFSQRLIPDRIDMVVAVTPISAAGPATATLSSGETVSIDSRSILIVGWPGPGALMIRGSQPREWLMAVARDPLRGCFWVSGWGTEEGTSIALDSGPVLPEALGFDRSTVGPNEHRFERSGFCLDERGQVTSVQL